MALRGVNLSSCSACMSYVVLLYVLAPQGIIFLLRFCLLPPPCLLFLLVPATPPRLAPIDPGLNWCDGLGSDVVTVIQKGDRGMGSVTVLQGEMRCGGCTVVVCAVVSSASFATASSSFPLSRPTVSPPSC